MGSDRASMLGGRCIEALVCETRRRWCMNDVVDPTLLDLDRFAIGQPVPRTEDPVLVSGKGQYTDDINLVGQAHAVIVRSHYAHGIIRNIDASAARVMPGVLG